ncbi:hypothetical protein ACP_3188 [Acidobacterium capsulatum ATCC 51196]|uniref:ParB/Sulfiredoxin domain-containing protein n=2 Tax=Acidobacteriaceae TaxID=204434 RepID=C1F5K8_ACIC5|nr:hypothetical protein ACP_3188 [Acidobacterium capsulatum ATCC 51196]
MQAQLEAKVQKVYEVAALSDSIVAQGWVPYDPIIVWEHPKQKGHYIVVEGNTRTVALRGLRGERLDRERKKLDKIKKSKTSFGEELKAQTELVDQLERVVASTDNLKAYPVAAKSAEELLDRLPRLMGVRHINHAQQWKPYATNLYILSLYERLFRQRYGDEPSLRIEQDLVAAVAKMVSLGETKTRRNIQAASAFTHFKRAYEEQLPEGEAFEDADHYYFELILQNKYPQEQFRFGKDALRLPPESEKALFQWAFSHPRSAASKDDEDGNENVFYKAENIRLWQQMRTYDGKKRTSFAEQFDVDDPDSARPMKLVESEYLQHKTAQSPIDVIGALVRALQELKGETLISQQQHLRPMLDEASVLVENYRKMMKATAGD